MRAFMSERERDIWLCLSGGNALGAYHAGAYQALEAAGIGPSRIAGASAGAVVAALIAGNAPEDRLERLRRFWERAAGPDGFFPFMSSALPQSQEKWLSLLRTLAAGRPGLFHPTLAGLSALLPGIPSSPFLFDTSPLCRTLTELIDFGRLNAGPIELMVTAVDIETSEDVTFDSHAGGITVEHIMASTAFPIAFPPVRIDGRVYVDPGVSANLPIAPLFSQRGEDDVLCLAIDLVPAAGKVPQCMDEAIGRTQDLFFASQSRHALRRLQDSARSPANGKAAILHVCYSGDGQEIGGKFLEFSRGSIDHRWSAGRRDVSAALSCASMLPPAQGRTIYSLVGSELVAAQP